MRRRTGGHKGYVPELILGVLHAYTGEWFNALNLQAELEALHPDRTFRLQTIRRAMYRIINDDLPGIEKRLAPGSTFNDEREVRVPHRTYRSEEAAS